MLRSLVFIKAWLKSTTLQKLQGLFLGPMYASFLVGLVLQTIVLLCISLWHFGPKYTCKLLYIYPLNMVLLCLICGAAVQGVVLREIWKRTLIATVGLGSPQVQLVIPGVGKASKNIGLFFLGLVLTFFSYGVFALAGDLLAIDSMCKFCFDWPTVTDYVQKLLPNFLLLHPPERIITTPNGAVMHLSSILEGYRAVLAVSVILILMLSGINIYKHKRLTQRPPVSLPIP